MTRSLSGILRGAAALLLALGVSNSPGLAQQSSERPPELSAPSRTPEPDAAQRAAALRDALRGELTRLGTDGSSYLRYLAARQQADAMGQHSLALDLSLPSRAALGGSPSSSSPLGGGAAAFSAAARAAATSGANAWTDLGPSNFAGRTRALVIDPTNPLVLYDGAASGGIWKSTDGGASWTPLGDFLPSLAVNALAMDPTNPQVLYAGTGEGFGNFDARGGAGIFVTQDGGATWTQMPGTDTPDFFFVNRIVVSPGGQPVYAATMSGVFRFNARTQGWAQILSTNVLGGCLELVLHNDGTNDELFTSCGQFVRNAVYRTKKAQRGAVQWETVLSQSAQGRTSIAIAPSNPNIVYAMASSNQAGPRGEYNGGLLGLFRSDHGGAPGTFVPRVLNTDGNLLNTRLLSNTYYVSLPECGVAPFKFVSNRGWDSNLLVVDPTNPDRVWAAGVDVFRSDDGGRTWGLASFWWNQGGGPSYLHAFQHEIVLAPGFDGASNKTLYVVNDGGVFRTDNALAVVAKGRNAQCHADATAVSWTALNSGLETTQFNFGDVFPDGTHYVAGTPHNGFLLGGDDFGTGGWIKLLGGDVGVVAIDQNNPFTLYEEDESVSLVKSTDGGRSWNDLTRGLIEGVDNVNFYVPYVLDPSDTQRIWLGGEFLWRSPDGGHTWQRISRQVTHAPNAHTSAIAVSPVDPNHVIAASDNGVIEWSKKALSANGRTFWPTTQPAFGYVTSLAFDPRNANVAYATYFNFGGPHLFKSSDGGATWTAVTGSGDGALPDIPANRIVIDPVEPRRLYLATEMGIFVSNDGGASWAAEVTGFPNVPISDLKLHVDAGGRTLIAFTHGRGAWKLTFP